ncbi:uncharacterized protein LOC135173028 [Diachasmimorpha longicaudata]|uniref:uncharacterized protein LOC135173028 n=1 Tax=Diachasmimorpha longicaudata TaxID=58733 RepID=UPI0030B8C22C
MRQIVYLILYLSSSVTREVDYCFENEADPYLYFGAKTPYRIAMNGETGPRSIQTIVGDCKPVQIWMLARHGTRYPQKKAIERLEELPGIRDRIIRNHEQHGTGHLCDADLNRLKEWSPYSRMTSQYASQLAPEGWREGQELGKRLKDTYAHLLQLPAENINSVNYKFRSIKGGRSESSMLALMNGLFDNDSAVEPVPTPKSDALLRGDQNCKRWSQEKKGANVERDNFIAGPEYAEMQQNVSRRIGFDVSPATIHNIQDMCRFESAWNRNELSPWCAVFSKEEWRILEYIDDLQYYYASGYGLEINRLIGCFPMENLFDHFGAIENGDFQGQPKGIFYFSTSRILMDFLHTMGIAKDTESLKATNFKRMADRKWRVSFISPFFSNFVAVFHRCNHSDIPNKVTLYLNEKLIVYDGCPQGICNWEYLKKKWQGLTARCTENCLKQKDAILSKEPLWMEPTVNAYLLMILLPILVFITHRRVVDSLRKVARLISLKFRGERNFLKSEVLLPPIMKKIILLCLSTYTLAREVDYCFVNETNPYLNFGVKTPYRFASTGIFERVVIPNCKPIRLWMLARHGTRYPQEAAVDRLQELHTIRWKIMHYHEKGLGRLCDEDVNNIREWRPHPHFTEQEASKITEEGWREGEELGRRLKDAYPELFSPSIQDINSDNYRFRSVKASRSILSLRALMKGLFGDPSAVQFMPNEKKDSLLRPDMNCYRWSHTDRQTVVPRDEFIGGPEYAELQQNVSRRIGFDVSPATIHNIQDMCRFETAWTRDQLSPWCAVFNKEEWKIIEYIDDIQYYYYSGYGVALNSLIGCFPAEDLIKNFRESEKPETAKNPKGIFYMSTSRVLMDFLHTMGIAKDSEHLLPNNYRRMNNRKWRTSLIAPFFANFIATFYRCNESVSPNKVTFHLNEKLIMYENCERGICDWIYIKEKLKGRASNCAENCDWSTTPEPKDERRIFLLIIALCIVVIIFHRGIARTLHRLLRCHH